MKNAPVWYKILSHRAGNVMAVPARAGCMERALKRKEKKRECYRVRTQLNQSMHLNSICTLS